MGIKLDFGAMSNTLEAQANHSGYTLGEDAKRLEEIKNARAMLFLHGILTESENKKIIKRICDKVEKALKPYSLPFGWYICKQNFDVELTDGACGSFLGGKKYYLEVIDNGYFIRDDFQQLIKMQEEMFKENFTRID